MGRYLEPCIKGQPGSASSRVIRDQDIREYGLPDGLHGTEGCKTRPVSCRRSHGNIWLSMNRGLSVVVPSRADGESVPAIPHVETVSVDGNPVAMSLQYVYLHPIDVSRSITPG